TAAQAVLGAVGDGDDLLVVAEGGHGDEWAEHFLLRHARTWTGTNNGRLDVTALRQLLTLGRLAAQQYLTAFFTRHLYIGEDPIAVLRRRERPHLGRRLQRVAQPN